jgi:hypothetical protein
VIGGPGNRAQFEIMGWAGMAQEAKSGRQPAGVVTFSGGQLLVFVCFHQHKKYQESD